MNFGCSQCCYSRLIDALEAQPFARTSFLPRALTKRKWNIQVILPATLPPPKDRAGFNRYPRQHTPAGSESRLSRLAAPFADALDKRELPAAAAVEAVAVNEPHRP